MSFPHRLTPGQAVRLEDITTKGKTLHPDRDEAERETESLREELIELQRRLYAERSRKLLIVLQAMDAGGKDGTIRRVFRGVNPQGVNVASFKTPTPKELSHDFLWRIHRQTPANGYIGIFNRSHYEDVLIVRVMDLAPKEVWQQRYEHINHFEQVLAESGTTILKFFLHISREQQKERMEDRLNKPHKRWKFDMADLDHRAHWDEYTAAYEDVLNRCTTSWAPWHVIPADQKWYRNLAIMRTVVATLIEMDPQYPQADFGLDDVTVE